MRGGGERLLGAGDGQPNRRQRRLWRQWCSGGAGVSSILTNAVSGRTTGGYLILTQEAGGGAGGNSNGGAGGQGAAATSSLNFNDVTANPMHASSLRGYNTAIGGNSGNGASVKNGGAAAASIALTGAYAVFTTADALGGAAGTVSGGAGAAGGQANASSTANATGAGSSGTAIAFANATGGAGSSNGAALASATATTANGQQAEASSTGSGGSGTAQTTATTVGSTIVSLVSSVAQSPVVGTETTALSLANGSGAVFGFNGGADDAYAFATANPGASFISSELSTHSNVNAALGGATATIFGTGTQGAFYSSTATGAQDYESSVDWTLNTSSLSGHLIVGLLDNQTLGTGFTSLNFIVVEGGATKISDTFTTLAAAQAFFSNDALDLGTFASTSNLSLDINFDLTTGTTGTGFGENFVVGTTATTQLAGGVTLASATEGTALPSSTTVATFTDTNTGDTAGNFTASINWGDGSPTTTGTVSGANGSFSIAGGHTYADEGSDPLTVTITDTLNAAAITPSGTVAVAEGDTLAAHATTFSAPVGTLFSGVVATFSDTTYAANVPTDFTATINWGDGSPTTAGTVSGGSGSPLTVSGIHTFTAAGSDTVTVILNDDPPGTATATARSTADVTPAGQTFHLTVNPDTVAGGAGNDTIIATSNTLSPGDSIDGGGGINTLALQGAGTFNLEIPTTLTNVEIVTAQEGQPAYASGTQSFGAQNQIITLRDGLNATVDVSPAASTSANNPNPPTITIVGANNADVINLASGNDVVIVGSTLETVHGGSGNDTIMVNSATIGAVIDGGAGRSTLDVTGGGTMAMGSSITDIANVLLANVPASSLAAAYNFTANALGGLTVNDDSTTTADTLIAGGRNQTLTGGGAGELMFVGSAAGGDIFKDPAALFDGDAIGAFGNNGDVIDLTDIAFASLQPLGYVQNNSTFGTLTVSDGAHNAAITLFGQFVASQFHPASDGGAGTAITDPPALQTAVLTPPTH